MERSAQLAEGVVDLEQDSLLITVTGLIQIFRHGLIAILPTVERLGLRWEDDRQYDDWDRLAEALYDVCVISPIAGAADRCPDEYPIPTYQFWSDLTRASWICLADDPWAMVSGLQTQRTAFDTVTVQRVDPDSFAMGETTRLPLEGLSLGFLRRAPGRPDELVTQIHSVESAVPYRGSRLV